jgi:drug/metabolite transporter (DMT)-like permease
MPNWVLTLLLVLVPAIWGWSFPAVKEAIRAYSVVWFLAIRFLIATAVLGVFTAHRIDRKSLAIGGAIGVVLAGAYLLQTFGLRLTTATNCGLITGAYVLFAPLASWGLFGVHTRPVWWVAVATCLVGLALLTGWGPDRLNLGDLLTLGSAAAYGLHIALLGRFAPHHSAAGLTLAQLLGATLVFLVTAAATEPWVQPSGEVWKAIWIMAIVVTVGTYPIQTYVQKRLPPVRTAVILATEAVFAAIFGYLLAGDRLAAVQVLGAVLVIGAVVGAEAWAAMGNRQVGRAIPPKEQSGGFTSGGE